MVDTCCWKEDIDGNYDTDCGQTFVLIAGDLEENGMRFCCYCGKALTSLRYCEELEP